MKVKITYSEKETEALGYELGLLLKDEPKVVILFRWRLRVWKKQHSRKA